MSASATLPLPAATNSRSAFAQIVLTETRLFLRERVAVVWAIAFPVALLVIVGSIPSSRQPSDSFGGLTFIDIYAPVVMSFVIAMLALNALPPILAGYREKGVLRRLSTTPVSPSRLLTGQIVVQGATTLITIVLVLIVGRTAFSVPLPRQFLGFVVAVLLGGAGLFAIGLVLAAVAPTGRVANALGAITFFPMMFFAGLWIPRQQMPEALRGLSDATPLGATVQAIQNSVQGTWPHLLQLGVMAAYAVVFSAVAVRLFRWE